MNKSYTLLLFTQRPSAIEGISLEVPFLFTKKAP
uniref:Uncharacterized protein n=1 Tax=Siphoviridae sp. ctBAZ2 TaxID=2827801 RepID=A0A8S5S7C3_9CAUD|nr:MAG TPA: hypothetical protein [Siphoviridae sp. ctBAZ2]